MIDCNYSDLYTKVLSLVESGFTIQLALKECGHKSTFGFYKAISDLQKANLKRAAMSNGVRMCVKNITRTGCIGSLDKLNFFVDIDD